jgi:hypothetical protein
MLGKIVRFAGMEKENKLTMDLKKILEYYDEKIERYETTVEKLVAKMDFCKSHNFQEEFRIANVEYQAVNMCVYRWREMHKEITDVVNAQMSSPPTLEK